LRGSNRSGFKNEKRGEQEQITRTEEMAPHVCCIVTDAPTRFALDVRTESEIAKPKLVQGCGLLGGRGAITSCTAGSFKTAAKEGSDFTADNSL